MLWVRRASLSISLNHAHGGHNTRGTSGHCLRGVDQTPYSLQADETTRGPGLSAALAHVSVLAETSSCSIATVVLTDPPVGGWGPWGRGCSLPGVRRGRNLGRLGVDTHRCFPGWQVTRAPPYVRRPLPSKEHRQIPKRDDLGPRPSYQGVRKSVWDPETSA
jgi:hypothetical protein